MSWLKQGHHTESVQVKVYHDIKRELIWPFSTTFQAGHRWPKVFRGSPDRARHRLWKLGLTGSTIEIVILSLKPIRETDNGSARRWAPQAPTARNNVGRSKRRRPSVATPSIISANSARFSSRISPIRCSILSGVR